MPELSVIVPIYNVEKYLEKCIDSILAQTYIDFELILINDGSPDGCAEIMEQYAKKDSRIVTIHQENKGVSAARNAGLEIAKGKYVGFVDPDDYIASAFFEKLINLIEINNLDIACCNWYSVFENGDKFIHKIPEIPEQMNQREFVNHIFDSPRTVYGSNCNKIFRKDKIIDFYDESIRICEDNLFLINYCKNIKIAGYINFPLYYVRERADSSTRKKSTKLVEGLEVRKKIISIAKDISKESGRYAEKDFLDSCYLYYKQFRGEEDKKYSVYSLSLLKDYLKKNFFYIVLNTKIYWKTKILYLSVCMMK